ncbi:MAG: 50S ribosomal protein L24 [Nanohaloarchaea archaeon QH_8_44_6]|nr:MAG: 50S ribosomal protein L24 [Nanohaloarchaea archaeon QH_8_44_6]
MTQKTENWSKEWKSSKNPSKQRKYRDNAPLHVKDKLVSANASHELRDELGTRTVKVRTGDRAKVMRGDEAGAEGIINNIDRENTVVYIDGIDNERNDGSLQQKALRPSNLQIVALNVEDPDRLEKFEVDDYESIQVDEEELEEALEEDEEQEMMQQMQSGESGAHEQFEDEETEEKIEEAVEEQEEKEESEEEEANEETTAEVDYDDVVSGTISDSKEKIKEIENPDFDALIEAEKDNKDRKTLKEYLENQKE